MSYMSEITSIWKKLGKRVCAIALVASFVLPLAPQIEMRVDAATADDGVVLEFVGDGITAGTKQTRLIADDRESVVVKATMSNDYMMSTGADAFVITTGDNAPNPETHFQVTYSHPYKYTFAPVAANVGMDPTADLAREYTILPLFTANGVTKGAALLNVTDDTAQNITYTTSVEWDTAQGIPLIKTSTLKFELGSNSVGTIKDVTGYLINNYEIGGQVTLASKNADGTELIATVVGKTPSDTMTVTMKVAGGQKIDLTKVTKIVGTIEYKAPPSNNLIIQMVTPTKAMAGVYGVLKTAADQKVQSDPTKIPTREDGKPYLVLESGDTFAAIKGKKISAVNTASSCNGTINIDWSWLPDNMDNLGLVVYDHTYQRFDVAMPEDDAKGYLVANLKYIKKDGGLVPYSDEVKIPVLIRGKGKRPFMELNTENYVEYGTSNAAATKKNTVFAGDDRKIPVSGLSMEVYDGSAPLNIYNPLDKVPPYRLDAGQYDLNIDFGTGRNAVNTMVITTTGEKDAVRVETENGGQYTWGNKYKLQRKSDERWTESLKIIAQKEGNVTLTFQFYGPTDKDLMANDTVKVNLSVMDRRPSDDPYLKTLDLGAVLMAATGTPEEIAHIEQLQKFFKQKHPSGTIDYGFSAENVSYLNISVPNVVEKIWLLPTYRDIKNTNTVTVTVNGLPDPIILDPKNPAASKAQPITLPTNGQAASIVVTSIAQSGRQMQYRLQITRELPSMDSALKGLVVKPESNSPETDYYKLTPDPFDPDVGLYEVKVPYYPDYVWVQAIANSDWSSKIEIQRVNTTRSFMERLTGIFQRAEELKIENLKYDENGTDANYNVTEVEVTVTPENTAAEKRKYTLRIIRQDPSDNAEIVEPKVSYWLRGNAREEIALKMDKYAPPPNRTLFTEKVPYSANQVRVVITPQDSRAQKVTVRCGDKVIEKPHKAAGGAAQPLDFVFTDVGALFNAENMLKLYVTVDAEKPGVITDPPYVINIERVPPNRDTTANVTLTNTITNAGIDFGYQAGYMNHTYEAVEVEYEPGDMQVLVTVVPKAASTLVKINKQDPRPIGDGKPGGTLSVPLTPGQTTTIVIVLTAEDNSTNTITIPVKYKLPSTAAYLQNLTVGTLPFLPQPTPFDKKKTTYSVEVPKGTTTLPVTPTLLKDGSADDSSKATIKINGKSVKDAEAFNFILTEKTGKIEIVVTAQDGKTKRTYVVNYKNWNLIVPKEDNLLKSLRVDYGELSPKFASNVQEYDVYVKPDAKDIKIYPKLKDKNGALRVVAGKVLAEFDGAYTTTIMEDEMDIFIYVWSEKDVSELAGTVNGGNSTPSGESAGTGTSTDMRLDKAKARQYVLHLYRGNEEKMGSFKPTTADQVDFESADPIVIDITQYPVISADVFNTLKTEYPEKSILFKGNDYTIQCFGEDINGLVPNAQSFDLRFSFYTPDEDKIVDLMNDYGGNGRVDPVYYYFDQHGALPAEMLLTVDLGRAYRNQTLFWNYYNEERERIDYYGYVRTNASGSFSVPISHFSTFLTTDIRVRGAENKSDEYGNPVDVAEENLNSSGSSGRRNPNTGVRG